jgi:hypothetical protein
VLRQVPYFRTQNILHSAIDTANRCEYTNFRLRQIMTTQSFQARVALVVGLFGWLTACSRVMCAQAASGAIYGAVLSEDGQPLPNATVIYSRLPRLQQEATGRWVETPNQAHVNSKVISAANGRFAITGLPDGTYILCVDAPGFLRSCDASAWSTVEIGKGMAQNIPDVRLVKAAVLKFRVNDPAHLLPADDRISRPLVLGFTNEDGAFFPGDPCLHR